jgi:hypothetical protein
VALHARWWVQSQALWRRWAEHNVEGSVSPSVRDLRGKVIAEDAEPVRRGGPVVPEAETATVLPPEALAAKRRVEARGATSLSDRAGLPEATLTPLTANRGGPVALLPADLEDALAALEKVADDALRQLDEARESVEVLRDHIATVRAAAARDAEAVMRLEAVRQALAGG